MPLVKDNPNALAEGDYNSNAGAQSSIRAKLQMQRQQQSLTRQQDSELMQAGRGNPQPHPMQAPPMLGAGAPPMQALVAPVMPQQLPGAVDPSNGHANPNAALMQYNLQQPGGGGANLRAHYLSIFGHSPEGVMHAEDAMRRNGVDPATLGPLSAPAQLGQTQPQYDSMQAGIANQQVPAQLAGAQVGYMGAMGNAATTNANSMAGYRGTMGGVAQQGANDQSAMNLAQINESGRPYQPGAPMLPGMKASPFPPAEKPINYNNTEEGVNAKLGVTNAIKIRDAAEKMWAASQMPGGTPIAWEDALKNAASQINGAPTQTPPGGAPTGPPKLGQQGPPQIQPNPLHTQENLEHTAKLHKMTVDQVKQQLGIQ